MLKKTIATLLVFSMVGCASVNTGYTTYPQNVNPQPTHMTESQKQGWALVATLAVFGGLTAMSYAECRKTTFTPGP